ncbi:hypothetical protein [Streptomyces sp. NPDC056707]|uniref:hypothetical protein n=1 Tax=Streptomyces sp. NPDC056707 TaxID=3345919 RepID=UPI0036CE42DF
MARIFSAEDEGTLRQLHADGVSRNEIARQMGWSVGTITSRARRLGLDFDRSATRAAVEARQIDLTAIRQQLKADLLADARRMREQLFAPHLAFSFGGRDNIFVAQQVPEPPPADKQKLMAAIGMAVDKSLRLEEFDAEHGGKNLTTMDRFLGAIVGERPEPDE